MTYYFILLKDVHDAVNRLEDKFDKRMIALEDRVEINESFRQKAIGMAGIIGAITSFAANWLWKELTKKG